MARKNPDPARKIFKQLNDEILGYGDEGKYELREIYELHHPEAIFKLPSGPDRSAKSAALIGDMKAVARELLETHGRVDLPSSKRNIVSKRHERFTYKLAELPDGRWAAKITRQGREIIPVEGAPKITDHPRLSKSFSSEEEADFAIRRIINSALVWYAERGITPREKGRRTKKTVPAIRRTKSEREARVSRQKREEAEREQEIKREERRGRRATQKASKRSKTSASVSRRRKLTYIPKGNPAKNPFTFLGGESGAKAQADKALTEFGGALLDWRVTLDAGHPDFRLIFKAYDAAENARANYLIAEDPKSAKGANDQRKMIRRDMISMFNDCLRRTRPSGKVKQGLSRNPSNNPSKGEHEKIGLKHLKRSEKKWESYCNNGCKVDDLLDSYKHLEIALEELKHAGNKEGVTQAKQGIKVARAEIRKIMRD